VSVLAACKQIALPVTGDGAILDLRRPLADRDGIDDLTMGVPCSSSLYGATDESPGPRMLNQLLFQHSSSLDKQTTVEGLVGHAHALVAGIGRFSQPEICCGDQFWISLLATIKRRFRCMASRQALGRRANIHACCRLHWLDTLAGRRGVRPPGLPSTQLDRVLRRSRESHWKRWNGHDWLLYSRHIETGPPSCPSPSGPPKASRLSYSKTFWRKMHYVVPAIGFNRGRHLEAPTEKFGRLSTWPQKDGEDPHSAKLKTHGWTCRKH
jgi:hypothetical protein